MHYSDVIANNTSRLITVMDYLTHESVDFHTDQKLMKHNSCLEYCMNFIEI